MTITTATLIVLGALALMFQYQIYSNKRVESAMWREKVPMTIVPTVVAALFFIAALTSAALERA